MLTDTVTALTSMVKLLSKVTHGELGSGGGVGSGVVVGAAVGTAVALAPVVGGTGSNNNT